MADIERQLISKVIYSGDLAEVLKAGVTPYCFHDDEHMAVWDWVLDHFQHYGMAPDRDALRYEYPNWHLAKCPQPLDYYVTEILKGHRRFETIDLTISVSRLVKDEEIDEALSRMKAGAGELLSSSPGTLVTTASDVEPEAVRWVWNGRIPLGKVTLLDGDPGVGKSTLLAEIAAHVTQGCPWPDGGVPHDGAVIYCNAEDDIADTMLPRLIEGGADLSKCHFVSEAPGPNGLEPFMLLGNHLDWLGQQIERLGVALVVLDPFTAFLPEGINSYVDAEVRRSLRPLVQLAADQNCAVLLIRHLNKSTGASAINRGGGSIGIIGAARCALLLANHPDDEPDDPDRRRVLAGVKSNLGPLPDALAFRLVESPNAGRSRLEWDKGAVYLTADELLRPPRQERRAAAAEWLRGYLVDGHWHPTDEIKAAGEAAGFKWRTIERAKSELGVAVESSGSGKNCCWRLDDGGDDVPVARIVPYRPKGDLQRKVPRVAAP